MQKRTPKRSDATASIRQANRIERLKAQGLVKRWVIYPESDELAIKSLADKLTREHLARIESPQA